MGAPQDASHHYHLVGGALEHTHLELHYRLLGDERLFELQEMEWFWQESGTTGQGKSSFSMLKPEAHLLYLCAHAILQHGEADFRLQRYYDIHLLALQPGFDWNLIIERAVVLGWTYALDRALSLSQDYFATPLPPNILVELSQRRQDEEKTVSRAKRLQGPGRRWEGTLLDLEGISFWGRLRSLFWLAFPPASYMRSRYSLPTDKMLLPYYFLRWFYAGMEIIQSISRRFRG
jgi:hypothetical protein